MSTSNSWTTRTFVTVVCPCNFADFMCDECSRWSGLCDSLSVPPPMSERSIYFALFLVADDHVGGLKKLQPHAQADLSICETCTYRSHLFCGLLPTTPTPLLAPSFSLLGSRLLHLSSIFLSVFETTNKEEDQSKATIYTCTVLSEGPNKRGSVREIDPSTKFVEQ